MDLEGFARQLYKKGIPNDEIVSELAKSTGSTEKASAILTEIVNSEKILDDFQLNVMKLEIPMYKSHITFL